MYQTTAEFKPLCFRLRGPYVFSMWLFPRVLSFLRIIEASGFPVPCEFGVAAGFPERSSLGIHNIESNTHFRFFPSVGDHREVPLCLRAEPRKNPSPSSELLANWSFLRPSCCIFLGAWSSFQIIVQRLLGGVVQCSFASASSHRRSSKECFCDRDVQF